MDPRLSADGPREVTLYVTGACDAHCAFCKRETDAGTFNAGTMRVDHVRAILDRFPTLQSACIAGFGEPLLVKHLGDVVALLRQRGLFVGVITNGHRLRDRAAEVLSWDLGYLSVSLNATTADQHAACFGTRAWGAVTDALQHVALAAPYPVGASFVLTRSTVCRAPAMVDLARRLRLRFAHLHNLLPHDGPRAVTFLGGVIREGDDAAQALERWRAEWEAQRRPGDPEVTWPAPVPRRGCGPLRCESPFMSIGVDAHGSVTGCRRVDEPQPQHGNIRDDDVWYNGHFTALRDGLSGAAPPPPTCLACFGRVRG